MFDVLIHSGQRGPVRKMMKKCLCVLVYNGHVDGSDISSQHIPPVTFNNESHDSIKLVLVFPHRFNSASVQIVFPSSKSIGLITR